MSLSIKELKELKGQISNLSEAELEKLAVWFARLREERSYQKRCDTISGIPYKDLLKAFKKQTGRGSWISDVGDAAVEIKEFFLGVRVQGCDPNDGEDVLEIDWGPESKNEFRLAYIREIGPPAPAGRDAEVWRLEVDMRFPMSPELERTKSGVKVFHTLREVDRDFYSYAATSKLGKVTRKLKPSRVTVTYENAE
jgi:hypothetical protein